MSPVANPYNEDGSVKRTVIMPQDRQWVYTGKLPWLIQRTRGKRSAWRVVRIQQSGNAHLGRGVFLVMFRSMPSSASMASRGTPRVVKGWGADTSSRQWSIQPPPRKNRHPVPIAPPSQILRGMLRRGRTDMAKTVGGWSGQPTFETS